MDTSKLLVVPKMSRFEVDLHKFRCTPDELIARYAKRKNQGKGIIAAHQAQQESLASLREIIPDAQFISREQLTRQLASKAQAVISHGGDNHLQYVAHFLNGTPLIGINSDPSSSFGGLCYFNVNAFRTFVNDLRRDNYKLEHWTRLDATIDGERIVSATGEYGIGERDFGMTTQCEITYKGETIKHKGSALLIATGAGSTGFLGSATQDYLPKGDTWNREARMAKLFLREPFGPKNKFRYITIEEGEELRVYSLNDIEGVIRPDFIESFDFMTDSVATVAIGKDTLNVIQYNSN